MQESLRYSMEFFGYMQMSVIAGLYGMSNSNFWRKIHTSFSSGCTSSHSWAVNQSPSFPISFPGFWWVFFFFLPLFSLFLAYLFTLYILHRDFSFPFLPFPSPLPHIACSPDLHPLHIYSEKSRPPRDSSQIQHNKLPWYQIHSLTSSLDKAAQ